MPSTTNPNEPDDVERATVAERERRESQRAKEVALRDAQNREMYERLLADWERGKDVARMCDVEQLAGFIAEFERLRDEEHKFLRREPGDMFGDAACERAIKYKLRAIFTENGWEINGGGDNHRLLRFKNLATKAGAILSSPDGRPPLDRWLFCLFLYLSQELSKEEIGASGLLHTEGSPYCAIDWLLHNSVGFCYWLKLHAEPQGIAISDSPAGIEGPDPPAEIELDPDQEKQKRKRKLLISGYQQAWKNVNSKKPTHKDIAKRACATWTSRDPIAKWLQGLGTNRDDKLIRAVLSKFPPSGA